MIERRILTGLIVSTEFTQQIYPVWDIRYLEALEIREVAKWALNHYEKYNEAPKHLIEDIYFEKLKSKQVDKDLAENIEDMLRSISNELEDTFNVKYALDKALKYFRERHLELHQERVNDLLTEGSEEEAETLASSYRGISLPSANEVDLSNPSALHVVETAFSNSSESLIEFPGALGDLWNHQMIRGGLIGLLAREKIGKTYRLLDIAMKGASNRAKVALFQAGDMTQEQQIKRVGSYLAKKPTLKKYCGDIYIPVRDCLKNQLDTCDKMVRECDFGPFAADESLTEANIRKTMTASRLHKAFEEEPEYVPCYNCKEWFTKPLGTPWVKKIHVPEPLEYREAQKKIEAFFIKRNRKLRISSHSNGTLSMEIIDNVLDRWEREDGFVADIILIDYPDIMITEKVKEFRHKQNQIWMDARRLSQERNALVIMPTQADTDSYKSRQLKLSNFSEDKRKYAHVTAMYGINQDKENESREKKLGIVRINELVVREGDFDAVSSVSVLQNLTIGRPFLGSYL